MKLINGNITKLSGQKINHRVLLLRISFIPILPILISVSLFAATQHDPLNLSLSYFNKNSVAGIHAKLSPVYDNIDQYQVNIFRVSANDSINLGSYHFSSKGSAVIELRDEKLIRDANGNISIFGFVTGSEGELAASQLVTFTPLKLMMEFVEKEGKRLIFIKVCEINTGSVFLPADNLYIKLFTSTLFGNMQVAGGYLLNGSCELDFPVALPGDSLGKVEITALLNNEKYGQLSVSSWSNWGVAKTKYATGLHHKLWTADPPVWIMVAFIIFIGSIWSVYVFVYLKIRMIKKAAK